MDQKLPTTIPRTGPYFCYDEYIKMGEHYSLTLSCPSHTMHHFTVTITDLLDQLHLNQHIYTPSQADMLCYSSYPSFAAFFLPNWSPFLLNRPKQPFLTQCSRLLQCDGYSAGLNIATYNVWNVNELGSQTASEIQSFLCTCILFKKLSLVAD